MYIHIIDGRISGKGQCPMISDNTFSIPVEEDVYNNYDKYIYTEEGLILNPNYEQEQQLKERERIGHLSLTKREVFLALYKAKQITPDILKQQITDPEALIEIEYANEYYRGNPLIDAIGVKLGITPEQLDTFFETNDYTKLI